MDGWKARQRASKRERGITRPTLTGGALEIGKDVEMDNPEGGDDPMDTT